MPTNGVSSTNAYHLTDTDGRANSYKRTTYVPGVEYHFEQNKFLVWTKYQIDKGNDFRADKGQLQTVATSSLPACATTSDFTV